MKIIIDGKECEAEAGEFILTVAKRNGIKIPTLCHSEGLPGLGSCRLCIVEVIEGKRKRTVTSCIFPITREIEVITNSEKIVNMRKTIIKLLSAEAPGSDKLKKLREEYGISGLERFNVDFSEKCVLCGLCVKACEEIGTNAISTVNRGITKKVSTPYDEPSSNCIGCGSCAFVCPTDAIDIKEKDGKRYIWGKTFELIKCENCGKYFTTKEYSEYVSKKTGDSKLICDKCRKKAKAEEFKLVCENIKP